MYASAAPFFPGGVLRRAREGAGVSVRELARRAGTSHPTILAYETGKKMPSIAVFLRLLEACGFAVDLDMEKRIRERDGVERGEELRQVLELAEQFPARMTRHLDLPCFGDVNGQPA
ncbi:MAG: helix-turn-helix transcriptional regulator [Gammaproteobacteria bacterium]|nr:helix-turn-helix transcriptional regulator [Gammaproteobacteria bacterium]